ncbi:MAG TPA: phosphatase PAP2 family protein [Acidimicrobiia bacterium]
MAVRSAATGGVVERVVERIRAVALVAAIGYVLLSVVTVTVGLALTKLTSRTWPVNLDFDAVRWLAHHRTSTFDTLSLIGSWLAGQWTVPLTVAVLLAVFALVRHWEWFTLFAVGPALEGLVYLTTTWVVSRERPPVPRLEDLIHNDSFYSGHTASAVVLWGSIAIVVCAVAHSRWIRVLAVSWAFVVPVLVASSRAYRGMHFPSDTIVGALVGLGCLTTAVAASRVAVGEPLPSRLGARFPS